MIAVLMSGKGWSASFNVTEDRLPETIRSAAGNGNVTVTAVDETGALVAERFKSKSGQWVTWFDRSVIHAQGME